MASPWNQKARLWVNGRKKNLATIRQQAIGFNNTVWIHCSSLGEFEQGRPLLENVKKQFPDHKIVLSFYSPSGYEIRKDYPQANLVCYLPLDTKKNARHFLDSIRPSLVIFVKYDFWYHFLYACKNRQIPLLLVSARFRKQQPFFQWYGGFHRRMLTCFTALFVQDSPSRDYLSAIGLTENVFVSGDTRFDRVGTIAEKFEPVAIIEAFCGRNPVLVAGSTWPKDERLIRRFIDHFPDVKLIIAPHEIDPAHLNDLKKLFPASHTLSDIRDHPEKGVAQILIIDNIGLLSKLYHYATFAFVGGGFDSGIHNILEAAVFDKPVFFGPRFHKFREANDLLAAGGAFSVEDAASFKIAAEKILNNPDLLQKTSKIAGDYVRQQRGATEKILSFIQEKRLLTS